MLHFKQAYKWNMHIYSINIIIQIMLFWTRIIEHPFQPTIYEIRFEIESQIET